MLSQFDLISSQSIAYMSTGYDLNVISFLSEFQVKYSLNPCECLLVII